MAVSDVVQDFLNRRRGWQNRGGAFTDGSQLMWKGIQIAQWVDGKVVVNPIDMDPLQSKATLALRRCVLTLQGV